MAQLEVSTTYIRKFLMVSSGDHLTGIVGKTVTVLLSKASSVSFATASGTVSEISHGWYQITLTSGDVASLGDLAFQCSATSADDTGFVDQIVSAAPTVTLASATHAGAVVAGVTSVTSLAGLVTLSGMTHTGALIPTVSTVSLVVSLTGIAALDISGIKAKTDNLPEGIPRNAAYSNFEFVMVCSVDHLTAQPGLTTISASRSIDGAAFASTVSAPSAVGRGVYTINLAAADLNGKTITLELASPSAADTRIITLVTNA